MTGPDGQAESQAESQAQTWDKASTKTFTHPFDAEAFAAHVRPDGRVLDLGCGYGRITAPLAEAGYAATGLDISPAMVARGLAEHPGLDLRVWPGGPLPFAAGALDAVVLFAVLNCIPDLAEQDALLGEIARVLAPGGVFYLSDYPIQPDERNQARYRAQQERFGEFGVFEAGGAVFRHHTDQRLDHVSARFAPVWQRRFPVATMNGNPALAHQMFALRGE